MEMEVPVSAPLPPGYTFVPKGDVYITRHCRERTLASGRRLYVVLDKKQRRIGLRCPSGIAKEVHLDAAVTVTKRQAAVAVKDRRDHEAARVALNRLFPRIPAEDATRLLARAFEKRSGRVGRTTLLTLDERVGKAVVAYARHCHTPYDSLFRTGAKKGEARKIVAAAVQSVVRSWRAPNASDIFGGTVGHHMRTQIPESASDSEFEDKNTCAVSAIALRTRRRSLLDASQQQARALPTSAIAHKCTKAKSTKTMAVARQAVSQSLPAFEITTTGTEADVPEPDIALKSSCARNRRANKKKLKRVAKRLANYTTASATQFDRAAMQRLRLTTVGVGQGKISMLQRRKRGSLLRLLAKAKLRVLLSGLQGVSWSSMDDREAA